MDRFSNYLVGSIIGVILAYLLLGFIHIVVAIQCEVNGEFSSGDTIYLCLQVDQEPVMSDYQERIDERNERLERFEQELKKGTGLKIVSP